MAPQSTSTVYPSPCSRMQAWNRPPLPNASPLPTNLISTRTLSQPAGAGCEPCPDKLACPRAGGCPEHHQIRSLAATSGCSVTRTAHPLRLRGPTELSPPSWGPTTDNTGLQGLRRSCAFAVVAVGYNWRETPRAPTRRERRPCAARRPGTGREQSRCASRSQIGCYVALNGAAKGRYQVVGGHRRDLG